MPETPVTLREAYLWVEDVLQHYEGNAALPSENRGKDIAVLLAKLDKLTRPDASPSDTTEAAIVRHLHQRIDRLELGLQEVLARAQRAEEEAGKLAEAVASLTGAKLADLEERLAFLEKRRQLAIERLQNDVDEAFRHAVHRTGDLT